ncbi:MAG: hypothetical protein GX950_02605 [Candidatus Diapherotrites archaeon]|uniref:Uncharacterized protein n=1 Tax=Candidatus Iainarchaeum sp. TaxID=3101447 RepID=A0A7K4BZJ0_9ARCH|nr:hypothetical protein [Candidatus Diapherotrites archaeon]
MSNILLKMDVDESLRLQLLAEEKKMRKKQPEAWTKTKFRKYANFGRNRKKSAEELLGLTSTRTDVTNLGKLKSKK